MNKKVSVLIPVYNAEKYLRECLDSVLAQSWTNFEVICCNDGSTDRSPEILREYAARDKRITVLSKKNEGSSATRNVCLEKATGDYLYFVDNDDMIAPDTLKDLVEAAEKDDLDVVYANPTWVAESPEMKDPYANVKDPSAGELKVQSGAQLFVSVVRNGNYYAAPWRRFIRADYARSIRLRFNGDASPNEDNLFSFYTDINAKRARFLSKRYYIHRSHSSSTMTRLSQNIGMGKSVVSHVLCAFEIMDYCSSKKFPPDVRDAVRMRVTTLMNGALRFFERSGLKSGELDWRGRWIEEHLFNMILAFRRTAPAAAAVAPVFVSAEDELVPSGAWGRFKRKLKRCLPMPHRTAMRKFDEVLATLSTAMRSPGALPGQQLREVDRKLEMLQLRLDGMQKGFASWGPAQAADWRCCGIDRIELFFVRVNVPRNFSGGVWPWRYQCMFKISGGGRSGWSELTVPNPENIHRKLTEISQKFCGKSLGWGMELCRTLRGVVPDGIIESLEMAMLDLAARVSGRGILDFLGLPGFDSVPYLECVLQKDPAKAEEYAKILARKYLKLKLFGDIKLDLDIVTRVRRVIPADCYLTADVNLGYCASDADRALPPDVRLQKVAAEMKKLQAAGLNACEDPAPFTLAEMQQLQALLTDMPIIPDAPMRPGYRICRNFKAVPGQIYNLHPHCMGSVRAALKLAEDIRASKGGVMIGDNSLIGVGCIQWQIIAGGCRADWCEAVEKSLEGSDKFAECLLKTPIRKCEDGFCRYVGSDEPGFGIVIDDEKLKAISNNHIVVTEEI